MAQYSKNDIVTVKIEDIGTEGEGIGKLEGFTLFVKDAVMGDVVEARLVKVKKNYAYARLEKVLTSSPLRVKPVCPYHKQCGGCQIQAMSYEAQLQFKENKVKNNLVRIGGFDQLFIESVMEPVVGMEQPWHYRNKAQFPVGTDKDGRIITGFYAGRTHSIIANTDCALGVEENEPILQKVLAYMQNEKVSAYDETTGQGLVRHILIRKGFTSGEIMVCLVINGKSLPKEDRLVSTLREIPGMTSIWLNYNTKNTNVIMGTEGRVLWGQNTITDVIHRRSIEEINSGKDCLRYDSKENAPKGITFAISPLSFYQVNPIQTEKLYSLALEYAGLTGEETVWDLYCGIGTISLFMAQCAKEVHGVEIVPQAIEDARKNAERNHIENATFYVGKAEEVLPRLYEEEHIFADVICVDPPRKGCDEACLNTIIKMAPKRIVYVSCDSATLARDLKYLCENGYEIRKVRAVDQFGQTVHTETVCLLSKLHEAKHHVKVKLDMDEMDITSAESKATYEEIKKYVAEHNDGMKVSNLYIAQIKQKHGIIERENYNKPKSEKGGQPECPKEKEIAIEEALKYFQMIPSES
ncbi:MAG: 23S rRNA (uracil(1939)-C(5))-methyltransferase RlmD [Lachnospiraceae bacterium]|jgi:23S rRNA (uracil-5-)-methyltransferase rumA|nr:MAG: 23S rRNA (uracil(1939)-C(5))-methyltransferase RlmD [Lachnospiraceae bacterium]